MIMPTGNLTDTLNAPQIDRCRAGPSLKRGPNAVRRIDTAGLPAGFDAQHDDHFVVRCGVSAGVGLPVHEALYAPAAGGAGAAFGWSIPMAFAAVSESVPLSCWLMFLANILWAVAYDTQYAMVDRDDDLKIGIKSTAILFGQNDKLIIGILQVGVLVLMALVGLLNGLGLGYYWSLLVAGALFVYQQKLIVNRERDACFKAFMNNNYVGLVLFLGLAMSYWHF